MSNNDWEITFIVTGPLEVEESESTPDSKVLTGTFLKLDAVTKNGREYQVEEGEQIASRIVGMPVYFGTTPVFFNTQTGTMDGNKHQKGEPFKVGRVIQALFDKVKKTILGKIEIWNTSTYPDLVERVRRGWGFSMGGKAMDLRPTGMINALGKAIKKVLGMRPNHLQLLEPRTPRGQDEAQVEDVIPVEESLQFDPCPWGACSLEESGNVTQITATDSTDGIEDRYDVIEEDVDPQSTAPVRRKIYILRDPDSKLNYVV